MHDMGRWMVRISLEVCVYDGKIREEKGCEYVLYMIMMGNLCKRGRQLTPHSSLFIPHLQPKNP